MLEWQAMAEGAYSANTLRAQKADGAIFQAFCESRSDAYLPADPKTIRAFIEDCVRGAKKPATIRRYAATIARVHTAAGLLNPCSSEAVRLGLKKMGRETYARQDQAHPLGWKDIKEFIDSAGQGLRADRERAMLCVAYETLARRGELVALAVKDIDLHPDGTGVALIRRGKTDAEGQGQVRLLIAGDRQVAEDLAGARGYQRRNVIPAAHWPESNRRTIKPREHRANIQAGGAMDWSVGETCGPGERSFHPGGCDAGPGGVGH